MVRFIELSHALAKLPPTDSALGTRIDSAFQGLRDGADLTRIPLAAVAALPALVVDAPIPPRQIELRLDETAVRDRAVLVRTGWDEHWGRKSYREPGPFLSPASVDLLVRGGAALLGLDFATVDDPAEPGDSGRTRLLEAGILIVEDLCNLRALPRDGFRFFAVPPLLVEGTSFPVRAFAELTAA
jgi:arylformamidase